MLALGLLLAVPLSAQSRAVAALPRASAPLATPAAASLSPALSASALSPVPAALSSALQGYEALERAERHWGLESVSSLEFSGALFDGASAAGETLAPAVAAPAPVETPAEFAAKAASALSVRADDMSEERGLKAKNMTGGQFVALLEDARAELDARADGPSLAAAAAAREVRAAIVRVARAMIPAGRPLEESIRRLMSVWQVFDQELRRVAPQGVPAVAAEARLFAEQVESSAPGQVSAPAAQESVPGSVFDWKPIESSPGHGLPWLDALIRRALADPESAYPKGFEFRAGAAAPSVFVYGERHSDEPMIRANMARLVADARPGRPALVLVESYVDAPLRGRAAAEHLAKKGADGAALLSKVSSLELRGWDAAEPHRRATRLLLRHHMDRLELNRLAHGEQRGWRYYRLMARKGWAAFRGWLELWRTAIVERNGDLDAALRAGLEEFADGTVHAIAGSDHLIESPLKARLRLARPSLRRGLREALAGRSYRVSQPPAR